MGKNGENEDKCNETEFAIYINTVYANLKQKITGPTRCIHVQAKNN